MKTLALTILLGLFSHTAMADFTSAYYADTNGTGKCKLTYVAMSWEKLIEITKERLVRPAGYSKCTHQEIADTISTQCEEPMKFKSIYTMNMASCFIFMKKHKLN